MHWFFLYAQSTVELLVSKLGYGREINFISPFWFLVAPIASKKDSRFWRQWIIDARDASLERFGSSKIVGLNFNDPYVFLWPSLCHVTPREETASSITGAIQSAMVAMTRTTAFTFEYFRPRCRIIGFSATWRTHRAAGLLPRAGVRERSERKDPR